MDKPNFQVGERIDIRLSKDNRVYQTVIEEIEAETFSIGLPYGEDGSVLVMEVGEYYNFNVISKNEQFFFQAKVKGRKKELVPMYVIEMPSELKRVQLRNFVRLDITLDVFYEILKENDANKPLTWMNLQNKAISLDLSAGGMKFIIKDKLEAGTLLVLRFELGKGNEYEEVLTMGRVIRSKEIIMGKQQCYQTAVVFVDISEAKMDTIVRFVFQKMLERRQLLEE